MAVTATPVFVQNPKLGLVKIAAADTTTLKTLVTAGANGSKVVSILAVDQGGDTSPVVDLYVTRSAVDYKLGAVIVATNAGKAGVVVSCDILGALISTARVFPFAIDNDGQYYLYLESGDVLKVAVQTTLGTGPIHVAATYGDF